MVFAPASANGGLSNHTRLARACKKSATDFEWFSREYAAPAITNAKPYRTGKGCQAGGWRLETGGRRGACAGAGINSQLAV